LFLLKEDSRQHILTVFNWTETPRTHAISFHELGLAQGAYTAQNVLRGGAITIRNGTLIITQPPHSVRMVKITDESVNRTAPEFHVQIAANAAAGDAVTMTASPDDEEPVLRYTWNFGDGISAEGARVSHAYTRAGQYTVTAKGIGLDGRSSEQTQAVTVTGFIPTAYNPSIKERFQPK
jgi:hypothetical protein